MLLRVLLASTGALSIGIVVHASAVPYVLSDAAEFTKGCYPPCECPLLIASSFSGGFTLEEIDSNPLFVTYAVEAIVMEAKFAGEVVPITGVGTYVVGGEVALLQRMELDLKVGDEPITHFDSGFVPLQAPFPKLDVTVSKNGMVCFDTVLRIAAGPQFSPADIDGDGVVGGSDLGVLLGAWGPCMPPDAPCTGDLDGDGEVGAADLGLLLAAWSGG